MTIVSRTVAFTLKNFNMINAIKFKNYKLFKNEQILKLKPITILIGKNSSGKSAIAKLLILLSESLSGKFSTPLKWENEIGKDKISLGTDFKDLVYNRNLINALSFDISSQKENLKIALTGDDDNNVDILEYILNGKELNAVTTKFLGFTNETAKSNDLKINVDYIGAFRCMPKSSYSYSADDYKKIGIEGQNAYPILIKAFLKSETPSLLSETSEWYETNFENWKLDVLKIDAKTETLYQTVLSNQSTDTKKSIKPINIVNVGEGMHQVLPLIVRSFMPDEEETLIIIEEPETHLHPAAHGNLAERFVMSHLKDKNKNYLIETHSNNFVLRMRRLVAAGILKKDDLAIYYVDFDEDKNESFIRFIEIDDEGKVKNNNWPKGVFSETLEETSAIRTAQLEKQSKK